jgi:hypothetical protein
VLPLKKDFSFLLVTLTLLRLSVMACLAAGGMLKLTKAFLSVLLDMDMKGKSR